MGQGETSTYVGPPEIRGSSIVGVFRDDPILRVILRAQQGPGLTLTFRDVTAIVENRAQGMRLSGLTRSAQAEQYSFVFVNRDQNDDACLVVTAAAFEVSSSP